MTDERLDEIKTRWNIPVTLPMSVPWGKDDVVWLVQEVERLRAEAKRAPAYETCPQCGRVDHDAYMCWRGGHLPKKETP